jgi:peptidoglycan-associated lipoprotein
MLRSWMIPLIGVLAISGCARNPPPESPGQLPLQQAAADPAGAGLSAGPGTDAISPGSLRDFTDNVGDRVLFAYDRADIDATAVVTLRRQATWLAQYPTAALMIEGHADERGTREYNLALAARRASAVREYLMSLGIAAGRLNTISYGKERPQCLLSQESCWAQNRRSVSTLQSAANF